MVGAQRIVIVGGGFGGLRAAQRLARLGDAVEITLIDRVNHHVFQPLLYQVATGILSPGQIAPALRSLFRRRPNVRVVLGEVTGFDLAARMVIATVPEDLVLPYDSLVVAAGSTGSYFGHEEWAPDAPGLKSLDDAQRIRTRVLAAYELAEIAPDDASRLPWLTFVVVGAGPTGVELCGQFAFLSRKTLAGQFRTFDSRQARVVLLDAGPAVLPTFPEKLGRAAARELERQGVEIRLSAMATNIDETGITISEPEGEERIATHTVVWAAGVMASPLTRALGEQSGAELDRAGRLAVEPDLSLPGHPEVFAIGDMVNVDDVPGVAQGALQEGTYVADVLTRRARGDSPPAAFHYRNKGNLAVVGRSWAVADIHGFKLSGRLAWLVWAFVHIAFLVGWQNRLETVRRWLWDLISLNRHERLISTVSLVQEEEARAELERTLRRARRG